MHHLTTELVSSPTHLASQEAHLNLPGEPPGEPTGSPEPAW